MARFFSLCLALVLFLSSMAALVSAAQEPFLPPDEVGARQDEFERRRAEIERLKDKIGEQRYLRGEDEEKERAILAELEDIDRRLAERLTKLDELNTQIAGQEKMLAELDGQLAAARATKDEAMRHLMRRIRAFYPVGKVGLLGVTFSRENLPELLKFHEAFANLIRYDEHALADYRQKYEQVRAARESQLLEQSVLKDSLAKMKDERDAAEGIKQERELLLEQVRSQADLRQRAIKEMSEAAGRMTASLRADINKERDKADDFTRFKGHLPSPLPSSPAITRFGEETTNKMGVAKKSLGLVFAARDGATALAVAPGVVIFAGYLRGYGNTVIIYHGRDFFTVTSRLERLACAKGDTVKAGAVLGVAGATAMVVDEGLYFELRQGQQAIDPLPWFASGQISFATLPAPQ